MENYSPTERNSLPKLIYVEPTVKATPTSRHAHVNQAKLPGLTMTEEDAIISSRRRVNELIVRKLSSQIYCSRHEHSKS